MVTAGARYEPLLSICTTYTYELDRLAAMFRHAVAASRYAQTRCTMPCDYSRYEQ
jgi:hypothetical protein